jgi:hypothetical protein
MHGTEHFAVRSSVQYFIIYHTVLITSLHFKIYWLDMSSTYSDNDEFQNDPLYQHYMRLWRPDISDYKGPKTLNKDTSKVVDSRYKRSFANNAFPPNILVGNQRKEQHRRLECSEDVKPWETPVPLVGPNNLTVAINDGGKVRLFTYSLYYIHCTILQLQPGYLIYLITTHSRVCVCTSITSYHVISSCDIFRPVFLVTLI